MPLDLGGVQQIAGVVWILSLTFLLGAVVQRVLLESDGWCRWMPVRAAGPHQHVPYGHITAALARKLSINAGRLPSRGIPEASKSWLISS
ncbi:hypothetical protein DFH09DRAFT_1141755 [Mycena vulgaris]|nr:hypothetical protein DFH09DRAFT_1141755 [Mycena vulgaris]